MESIGFVKPEGQDTKSVKQKASEVSAKRRLRLALLAIFIAAAVGVVNMLSFIVSVLAHWAKPTTVQAVHQPEKPFELSTVHRDVPFIAVSEWAGITAADPNVRRQLEEHMRAQSLFDEELLGGGARYIPTLRDSGSALVYTTLSNGGMKRVVVQLINEDGS